MSRPAGAFPDSRTEPIAGGQGTNMSDRKVMIIGLDAATMDLVGPWAEQGLLPNLARFMREGTACPLLSTLPAVSPGAWSTFATGLNPGKHGILNFAQLFPDSYDAKFVNASHRRGATFWEIAGQHGVKGGIVNVPVTYPPRPYNGFLISGMLSPGVNRRMATPPEIFDDVMSINRDYRIDVDLVQAGKDIYETFLDCTLEAIKARQDVALGLYRQHRPPLFCAVFIAADRVCHYYWDYMEQAAAGTLLTSAEQRFGKAIQMVYQRLDEAVGALVDEAGPDTDVLMLSDHGAGPVRKSLSIRKALAQAGLLVEARSTLLQRLGKRPLLAFSRVAPRSLRQRIMARFPRLSDRAVSLVISGGVDWSRTKAYSAGGSEAIYINLKGRQPNGIVEPGAEYEKVRDEVIDALVRLVDPETGEPVFAAVHRSEEVWSGPCLDRLPDLVLEQRTQAYETKPTIDAIAKDVFNPQPERSPKRLRVSGRHQRNGLLMAMGPHIKKAKIKRAEIADVPATVLTLLGLPVPEDFDGRVLTEMLTDDAQPKGTTAAAVPVAAPTDPKHLSIVLSAVVLADESPIE